MKILFFTQFYKPETMAASFRASENAKIWKENGHEVTIFTLYPNYPYGKIFEGYNPSLISEETIDGIKVIRSKIIPKPNKGTASRLWNFFNYFLFGIVNIIFNRKKFNDKYDVVLGTSGGIFFALLGYIYSRLHHINFIFEIRDLTYVQMIATGKKENSFGVKVMKWLELYLCKKAKAIVTVTRGFKEVLISQGIFENKIYVITNGVDISKGTSKKEHDGIVLGYFGTLGISQNIRDTFPLFEEMRNERNNLEYLIIGEGAQRDLIEEEIKVEGYEGITLLHGMSPTDLEPYYEGIDFSVIILRKKDSFKYTIPSKVFQAMGRGLPVLFYGPDGEAAEIIRSAKAGIVLCGTLEEDKKILTEFLQQEDLDGKLNDMGRYGREYVLANYSRVNLANDYLRVLEFVGNYKVK